MPANKKHLSSTGQRFLKITAGVLGGLIVSFLFHITIGVLFENKGWLIITSYFSFFIIWAILMVFAFMAKSGWKIWTIYLCLILVFSTIIYLYK